MRRFLTGAALLALVLVLPAAGRGDVVVGPGGGTPGTAQNFTLVGHNALFNRGMNAAPAMFDHYLYVGNRTDGSTRCGFGDPRRTTTGLDSCPHPNAGILIVDVADPANPTVVGEIGPPNAANPSETTRELRVWPQTKLLMVLNFRCSPVIHACAGGAVTPTFRFFDLSDPVHPELLMEYVPVQVGEEDPGDPAHHETRVPHEFFLWLDPKDPNRALLWSSTPTTSCNPERTNLIVYDISDVPDGDEPTVIAQGNWNQLYPGGCNAAAYDFDLSLHSMTPSYDGTKTYLAYLRGTFLVLDTSKVANNQIPAGTVESLNDDLLTPIANRPLWGTGNQCAGHTPAGCAESHSAVPLPGRPFAFTVDEVYGTFTVDSFGWPWGWTRLINVAQPRRPHIVGEYKIHQNTPAYTPAPGENEFNSYSSHNPTVTRNVVLDAWHSGGLQAIDVSDPAAPAQLGWYSPTPLAAVANEDPALSRGPNKVVMWSFPIIRDGLIYVVDIRNGLYVFDYNGPRGREIDGLGFLEGNSNLGDAGRLAKSAG
jgi:hypothetical protein